jgi:hypothetical protein
MFGRKAVYGYGLGLEKKREQARIDAKEREQMGAKRSERQGAGGDSVTWDAAALRARCELLRELLAEVDGLADRIEARGIRSVSLGPTSGAAAYGRAEKAILAWSRGVRDALLDSVKGGSAAR